MRKKLKFFCYLGAIFVLIGVIYYYVTPSLPGSMSPFWLQKIVIGRELPGQGDAAILILKKDTRLAAWRGGFRSLFWSEMKQGSAGFGPVGEVKGEYRELLMADTESADHALLVALGWGPEAEPGPASIRFPVIKESAYQERYASEPDGDRSIDEISCGARGKRLLVACLRRQGAGWDSGGSAHLYWREIDLLEFDIPSLSDKGDSPVAPITRYPRLIVPTGWMSPFSVGYVSDSLPCVVWMDGKGTIYVATTDTPGGRWDIKHTGVTFPTPVRPGLTRWSVDFQEGAIDIVLSPWGDRHVANVHYNCSTNEVEKQNIWDARDDIEGLAALTLTSGKRVLAVVVDKGSQGHFLYFVRETPQGYESEMADKGRKIEAPALAADSDNRPWILYGIHRVSEQVHDMVLAFRRDSEVDTHSRLPVPPSSSTTVNK
jgi:hypothetical protein